MQWNKDRWVKSSPEIMGQCLDIICQEPGKYTGVNNKFLGVENHTCFLFASGAKLARSKNTLWYIYGYAAGGSDIRAAICQLKAADHIRQAISLMFSAEDQMQTPRRFRIKRIGLWGTYDNGQRSPSLLNMEPNVRETNEELV